MTQDDRPLPETQNDACGSLNPALLETLLAAAPAGVIFLDPELRVIRANAQLAGLSPLDPAEWPGRPLGEVLPQLGPRLEPLLRQALHAAEPLAGVEIGEEPGGQHLVAGLHPLRDKAGAIIGVCAAIQDLTEQRRTAAQLRELADRYHELFVQAQDIVYVLDAAGNLLDMNAAGERITGYTREELLGRPITQLVLPEHLPAMHQMLERKIDGAPVTSYELEIVARDGRRVVLDVNTRLVYRDGRPVEIHGIARDVTSRKHAHETQHFLADVSQALSSSLDDDTILAHIAALAVPRIADFCIVDVVEPDGEVRRAAALHADPDRAPALERLAQRYSPSDRDRVGVPWVLREGQTLFSPSITAEQIAQVAQDAEHLELLQALDPGSAILVAIRLEGQVSGVITLVRTAGKRPYEPADVALAEELARRAGQALANARLYRASRRARLDAERAAQRMARLQVLTAAFAEARTVEQVTRVLLAEGVPAAGASGGGLGLLQEAGATLELTWSDSAAQPQPLTVRVPLAHAAGFAAAIGRRAPVWQPPAAPAGQPPQAEELPAWGKAAQAYLPLIVGQRPAGAIGLRYDAGAIPPEDQVFALALAQQCAQALERARLLVAEQEARRRAEGLYQVTSELAQALTPAEVADVIVRHGIAVAGAYAGTIIVRAADGRSFEVLRVAGYPPGVWDSTEPLAADAPLPIVDAARTGEPIWLSSRAEYASRYPHLASSLQTPSAAIAAVPLLLHGRPLGALGLSFSTPHAFDADERALLLTLAQQCAQALERARLYTESQAQAARMAVLAEASQAFASTSRDLPALLDVLAQRVAASIGDLALVELAAGDEQRQELTRLYHPDPEALEAMRQVLAGPSGAAAALAAWVQSQVSPLHLPSLAEEHARAGGLAGLSRLRRAGVFSLVAVPLRVQGQFLGTLAALRTTAGQPYTRDDVTLLQDLADRAALAINHARLYATEQRARAQAEAAVQARDAFFSVAAHELKTPLTSLLGQAQLLQRRDAREQILAERERRSVDMIVAQAQRLNRLTLGLLDTARIQQGRLTLDRAPFDLADLVQRIVGEIQPTLKAHRLSYTPPDGPLVVHGDALRLEQVVINLIENAVKYSPAGGPIDVQLARDATEAAVRVADQGIGIPAAELPHLFTRFYRAANASRGQISGMGIGLFVVHEIITLHGGRVTVESEEGRGSVFTVHLPLHEPPASSG